MLSLEGLGLGNVDGRVLPRLAQTWRWENDGRTLRIQLRGDVLFHDGTPLTSEVAASSLRDAIARPDSRALYPGFSDVIEVRTDGPLQLVLDLSQPSTFLLDDLTLPIRLGRENVGTGPYRVVKGESSEVYLERFEHYYLGQPAVARISLRPFDALRTAWSSLLRGEVDMVTDVPADAVEFVSNDDVNVITYHRWYQFMVAFNSRRSPLSSPVVRRALNMAVDRDRLIRKVLKGYASSASGPLWPEHWAYDRTVQPHRFDPSRAVALLEDAGFHRGAANRTAGVPNARLRFTCLLPENFSVLERIGLEVQKQLYDIGVDMQFEVVSLAEYDTRLRDGQFDAVLVDMISGPTLSRAYLFWRSARDFKGYNVFGYENDAVERSFHVLRTSTSEAAVRSATQRLQNIFLEDPPALFLAWNQRTRAIRRDFDVVYERTRDPLLNLWRWTAVSGPRIAVNR
jgi:peptide/nickel transport system substrate-binding protein